MANASTTPPRPILHILTVGLSGVTKERKVGDQPCGALEDIAEKGKGIIADARSPWSNEEPEAATNLEANANVIATALQALSPTEQVGRRPDRPDYLPAEISSLQVFYSQDLQRKDQPCPATPCDKVILLVSHTSAGWGAAKVLENYINRSAPPHQRQPPGLCRLGPTSIGFRVIQGLADKDAVAFENSGLANLARAISESITDWRNQHGARARVVVNLTGGFKGAIPYLVLACCASRDIEIQYLYEESPSLVTVPTMPLALDLTTWRDQRGLLRLLPELGDAALLQTLSPQARALFRLKEGSPPTVEPNFLYELLRGRYDNPTELERALSRYGPGTALVEKVADPTSERS